MTEATVSFSESRKDSSGLYQAEFPAGPATTAQGINESVINETLISSRSDSNNGTPGILGSPTVGRGQQHRSS